jgi:hypothetical protein
MFLSTPAKIFHATWCLIIIFTGCTGWRSNENSSTTFASEPKSAYPFSVSEPTVFQADLVIRTGEIERKLSLARNGNSRRMDFDIGTENHRAVLITDKEYLLFFKRKSYEARTLSANATAVYDPLTAHMLSARDLSTFEEVGRKGEVVQYRLGVNESTNSEVLVFFDEAIGLPVREEFYSIEGDARNLQYTVELENFRPHVDPAAFEIPGGFRKVSRGGE